MKLIALLLAMLASTTTFTVCEENITNVVGSDHNVVGDYIENNLVLFSKKCSEQTNETFSAESVEFRCEVFIIEKSKYASYLDFNDNNGYLLIADNYDLLTYSFTGQLPYFSDYIVAYSIYDGFGYIDQDSEFISFSNSTDIISENAGFSKACNGQNASGSGEIYDTIAYVNDRYGNGYALSSSKSLKNWTFYLQNDLNQYWEKRNEEVYGEGNCLLTAIYGILDYWAVNKGKSCLPTSDVTIDISKDSFYNGLISSKVYTEAHDMIPTLYNDVRTYYRDNCGYKTEGASPFNATSCVKSVSQKYNASMSAKHILIWSFSSQVKKEIDNNRPTIWNEAFGTYKDHSMIVKGYEIYSKTTSWWIFKSTSYVYLMEMNDNYDSNNKYIDFDYYSNYDGVFGSFIKIS